MPDGQIFDYVVTPVWSDGRTGAPIKHVNLFEVIGEGHYDGPSDGLFLPDIDPETPVGWPEGDYFAELDEWEREETFTAYSESARYDSYDEAVEW